MAADGDGGTEPQATSATAPTDGKQDTDAGGAGDEGRPGNGASSTSSSSSSSSGMNGSSSSSSGSSSPSFTVKLTTGSTRITDRGVEQVIATVDDGADGFTIAGGELVDESSGRSFGKFGAGAHGQFSMLVSWNDLHAFKAINFSGAGPSRTLTATFYNQSAKRVSASVTLSLYCDGGTACAGRCTNLQDYVACGACGKTCPSYFACAGAGVCRGDQSGVATKPCTDICSDSSATCLSGRQKYRSGTTTPTTCAASDVAPPNGMTDVAYKANDIQCDCTDRTFIIRKTWKAPGKSCRTICRELVPILSCVSTSVAAAGGVSFKEQCDAPYVSTSNLDPIDGRVNGTISVPNDVVSRECACQTSAR